MQPFNKLTLSNFVMFPGEYVEKLSETGTLTRDTYNRLRGTLKALLIDLQKLGYHLHCNPLLKENVDKMTQFIKDIQEDCRLGNTRTVAVCFQIKCIDFLFANMVSYIRRNC